MKKRILAFGDSNTWGWKPSNGAALPRQRFDDETRWTGVAQAILGEQYLIINEGLNARTTVWEDPLEEYRCGKEQIVPIMDTQAPLDLVIIMLGTNDLKRRFAATAEDIAHGAGLLCDRALALKNDFTGLTPRVLLICPPRLGPVSQGPGAYAFGGSEQLSAGLHPFYQLEAQARGIHYLNAGAIVTSSQADGIHLEQDQHEKLGQAVAQKIKEILG